MSVIDDIKQRLDIVEVISTYLPLEKAGRNFKAICPFHQEKTPSFFVSPERQSWHCFGCGAGGDIFAFVKRKEGVDFSEALKILAQKAGVTLAQRGKVNEKVERLYRANEAAAGYYHHLLWSAAAAQVARAYLEHRAILRKTTEEFQIGYSLDSWEGLKQYLKSKGFSEEELISSGLLIAGEKGAYDRFRGRLMFPISDIKGRVLGFGARALDDSTPKYVNSAQTPIFDKGAILYGLDRAKEAIREQKTAVIVEGYMDVLTAHQHGIRNVVATMGTALTERQVAAIKGLCKSLTLALDADAGGEAATWRGIEILRQALAQEVGELPDSFGATSHLSTEIKVISLPQGKDPDDMIRESVEEWHRLVNEALPVIDYFFVAASELDLSKPEGRFEARERLLPLITEMEDKLEREHYLRKLAELTGDREETLRERAAQIRRTRSERGAAKPFYLPPPSGDPLEEYCLCLLLQYPELRGRAESLSPKHFERSENRELFITLNASPEAIERNLDATLHGHLKALSTRPLPQEVEGRQEKELADCIRRLEERQLRARLIFEAEAAISSGEDEKQGSAKLGEIQQRIIQGWR